MLFTPGILGSLEIPNRLVRSATAERMADDNGLPLPSLGMLYQELSRGQVGLIISGHMFIADSGKCHPEMTSISTDAVIQPLRKLTDLIHQEGGFVAAQINHGGGNCAPESVAQPLAPSAVEKDLFKQVPRALDPDQIHQLIDQFADAALRVKQAGFDAVQIHSAHGYLNSQFLSPLSNHRTDNWGGNLENRSRFLRETIQAVRQRVGDDYPVLIKFGIADGKPGGFELEEGLELISKFESWGLDGVEISSGFSGEKFRSIRKGIRTPEDEGYFLPFVEQARSRTDLPLIAVGGFRSRKVMERALLSGAADFIALCRPLIREPDLPRKFREGISHQSTCISANNCWAEESGQGISCKCP